MIFKLQTLLNILDARVPHQGSITLATVVRLLCTNGGIEAPSPGQVYADTDLAIMSLLCVFTLLVR